MILRPFAVCIKKSKRPTKNCSVIFQNFLIKKDKKKKAFTNMISFLAPQKQENNLIIALAKKESIVRLFCNFCVKKVANMLKLVFLSPKRHFGDVKLVLGFFEKC
jgi:hypothetical protein